MTLEQAVAAIDFMFDAQDGPPMNKCPTGEPYVVLMSGGLKKEGALAAYFPSEEAAVRHWVRAFLKYALECKGKLFWRMRPSMTHSDYGYAAYSRLIISDGADRLLLARRYPVGTDSPANDQIFFLFQGEDLRGMTVVAEGWGDEAKQALKKAA